jgi:hypothetical protein
VIQSPDEIQTTNPIRAINAVQPRLSVRVRSVEQIITFDIEGLILKARERPEKENLMVVGVKILDRQIFACTMQYVVFTNVSMYYLLYREDKWHLKNVRGDVNNIASMPRVAIPYKQNHRIGDDKTCDACDHIVVLLPLRQIKWGVMGALHECVGNATNACTSQCDAE